MMRAIVTLGPSLPILCSVACGGSHVTSGADCGFTVTLDGGMPDAAAYEGGTPYGGDLPRDECDLLCGTRGLIACRIASAQTLSCIPGCF